MPRKGHILPVDGTCASIDGLTPFNNSTYSTEAVYTSWSETSNVTIAVYIKEHTKRYPYLINIVLLIMVYEFKSLNRLFTHNS